jgi:hypothetical protein
LHLRASLQAQVDDEDSVASPLDPAAASVPSGSLDDLEDCSSADDEASSDDRTAWEDEDEGDDEDAGVTCDKITTDATELPFSDKDVSVSQIGDNAADPSSGPTPEDGEASAPVDLDEPALDNDSGFEGNSCDENEDQGSVCYGAGSAVDEDR